MSYAILITGQTAEATKLWQLIVEHYNGKNLAWSRITDGGRGESNAWTQCSYENAISYERNNSFNTVGAVLSTPLTPTDTTAIVTNEKPVVLIQKLTKQFSLRDKTINTHQYPCISFQMLIPISDSAAIGAVSMDSRQKHAGMTMAAESLIGISI